MEAKSGSFVYRDAFLVEVAEGKRHARASDPELRELLLPKKGSAPAKDQVAHFYEAQLLHYGLPRTKDKNTAKVRLLGALTSGKLSVPTEVQKVEAELKKEYAGVQRKAKAAAKKDQADSAAVPAAGKKRKAGDLESTPSSKSATTKISVKVGDMTFEIDQQTVSTTQTTQKKQKVSTSPAKASAKKTTKAAETKTIKSTPVPKSKASAAKEAARPKPATKPDTKSKVASPIKSSTGPPSGIGNHPRTKQTARRSKHPSYADRAGGQPAPAQNSASTYSDVYYENDAPPPSYTEYNEAEYNEEEQDQGEEARVVQISGDYSIRNLNSGEEGELSLRLSNQHGQMWGNFELSGKIGVVRLDNIDGVGQGIRKSFGWRSEDINTGDMRFGKGCDGWFEFNGHGFVRGCFYALVARRDVEFEGQLEEDFSYESDYERDAAIDDLSARWHDFPERAYRGR